MSKVEKAIVWGAVGAFAFWMLKKEARRAPGEGWAGGNGDGSSKQPYRLGTGSLGGADAYTDAFPEDGIGGIDPGR